MDKAFVFAVLGLALVMFVTGWWRYDLVALVSLLILVVADIIPFSDAYAGFSHPAVVTVAAVLVLSRTLHNSGAVDIIAKWMASGHPSCCSTRGCHRPYFTSIGFHEQCRCVGVAHVRFNPHGAARRAP